MPDSPVLVKISLMKARCIRSSLLALSTTALILPTLPLFSSAPTLPAQDTTALQPSAQVGDAQAQFELARRHLKGSDGIPKDVTRAFELMSAAANQGHAEAMGGMGYFYAQGIAAPKDRAIALAWFEKGARAGSAKACFNFGKLSREAALNDPESEQAGWNWIQAASDQGLLEALAYQGEIYFFGDAGRLANKAAAMPPLEKAAALGHANSLNLLGMTLESGAGEVPVDQKRALECYRKAAMQGHSKAQANLGRLLGPEEPDRETRLEAIAWLIVASDKEITAQRQLEEVSQGTSPEDLSESKRLAAQIEIQLRERNYLGQK